MSGILGVSRSGFYDWQKRIVSSREWGNRLLSREIKKVFADSGQVYGSPKITKELIRRGFKVSRKRVFRLMKIAGIKPIIRKKWKIRTTDSRHNMPISPDLLQRDFYAAAPDRKWVSDITYVRTTRGWLYLCVVMDLYSRRIVGWSLRPHMRSSLVCEAFLKACESRNVRPRKLVFHSDRGSQYASRKFRRLLHRYSVRQSMSGKGDCFDNACAESVFGIIKTERIYNRRYENKVDAYRDLFQYIEGFYNRRRIHSYLDYMSPEEFETLREAA